MLYRKLAVNLIVSSKDIAGDLLKRTHNSRMNDVCAGQRLEFDSPRLHHFEQSLMQVIAEYFGDSE